MYQALMSRWWHYSTIWSLLLFTMAKKVNPIFSTKWLVALTLFLIVHSFGKTLITFSLTISQFAL